MITDSESNEFLSNMRNHACREFRETDLYYSLKETRDRIENDCKLNLADHELVYAIELIDAYIAVSSAQSCFMYERGYRDCVAMLKRLHVI